MLLAVNHFNVATAKTIDGITIVDLPATPYRLEDRERPILRNQNRRKLPRRIHVRIPAQEDEPSVISKHDDSMKTPQTITPRNDTILHRRDCYTGEGSFSKVCRWTGVYGPRGFGRYNTVSKLMPCQS